MKQSRKISLTILATVILLGGLTLDIPGALFLKYFPNEQYVFYDFDDSKLAEKPIKIYIHEKYDTPRVDVGIKFKIKAGDTFSSINLFQTSNDSDGLQIVLSDNGSAISYSCKIDCPAAGLNDVDIKKYLNFSGINNISLTIFQKNYLKFKVNSSPEVIIKNPPPDISFANISLNSGVVSNRGAGIEVIKFYLVAQDGDELYLLKTTYYSLLILLFIGFLSYLKITPTR